MSSITSFVADTHLDVIRRVLDQTADKTADAPKTREILMQSTLDGLQGVAGNPRCTLDILAFMQSFLKRTAETNTQEAETDTQENTKAIPVWAETIMFHYLLLLTPYRIEELNFALYEIVAREMGGAANDCSRSFRA